MVETVIGFSGDDVLENTSDDQNLYGLTGNDTLEHSSLSNVALIGGPGDDQYTFQTTGALFVLENGNDANDKIVEVANPNAPSSFIYTLESRHLVFEHSDGTTLVVVDWERPENRIETWEIGGSTYSYSEFQDFVSSSGNFLGNFSFDQVGFSEAEIQVFNDTIDSLYAQEAELNSGEINSSITRIGTSEGETIIGGSEGDRLEGDDGDDSLDGGAGNDTIDGGLGQDVMAGGEGNDLYYVDQSDDVIVELEGEGQDSVLATASYDLSGSNVENIILIESSDSDATGNNQRNLIGGNSGDNILIGQGGVDVFFGGGGRDVFVGGTEYDVYLFNSLDWDVEIRDGNSLSLININDTTAGDFNFSEDGRDLIISDPFRGGSILIRGYFEDPSQYIFVDSSNAYVNLETPDDSILYSRFVGLSSDVQGSLDSADTSDFYQIKPEADGVITVSLSGHSEIIDVLVYDQAGVVFEAGKTGSIMGLELKFDAVADQTYYVELRTQSGLSTNYEATFNINYGRASTLADAIEIGSDARIDLATIGGVNDPADYYAYTAAIDGQVSITLTMLSENVDLIIYDMDGEEISSSRQAGDDPENLELSVFAGDQFIIGIVAASDNQSTYSLLVDSTDFGEFGGDAGGTIELASSVPTSFALSQSVGFGSDNDDLFEITPTSDGVIDISLEGFDQDLDLHLYDSAGELLTSSQELLFGTESLQLLLDQNQTYYIGVTPANGLEESEYTLQANFTSSGPEPGETFETALQIDPIGGFSVIKSVGFGNDSDDLFVFTATDSGNVSINLVGFSSNLDLHVYNPSGARIASSRNSGTQSEAVVLSVQEGEQYYIGATPVTSQGSSYELNVSYSSSTASESASVLHVAPEANDI